MTKITLITEFSGSQIKIKFNENKAINIDTGGDIELTEFVRELTKLIDEDVELELQKHQNENPKIQLILDTIEKMVQSFNQSNEPEEPDFESGVPF